MSHRVARDAPQPRRRDTTKSSTRAGRSQPSPLPPGHRWHDGTHRCLRSSVALHPCGNRLRAAAVRELCPSRQGGPRERRRGRVVTARSSSDGGSDPLVPCSSGKSRAPARGRMWPRGGRSAARRGRRRDRRAPVRRDMHGGVVPGVGLEPTRPRGLQILSLLRLPIPPSRQGRANDVQDAL
jgi:hypothetical protein